MILSNAFLLQSLEAARDSFGPKDKIVFLRWVTLSAAGHAVINDLGLRPGALVSTVTFSATTVASGTGTMTTSSLATQTGSVCIAPGDLAANGNAPAIEAPGADAGTVLVMIIANVSDLAQDGVPLS